VSWLFLLLLAADPPPRVHQEIVITAERSAIARDELTTATTVLTRADVEAVPATNAAEVLALIPGMSVFSAGSTVPATLTLRGFYGGGEADSTRLLVDGVPLADAESNLAPWQQLRAGDIERVEVARGLASPVYGDAAFGGVVQLFTRTRTPGDWDATLTAGTRGTAEASANAWLGLAGGELAIRAGWRDADGDRPHSAATQHDASLRWRRELRDALLSLHAGAQALDRDDPGPLPLDRIDAREADPLFARDGEETRRVQLAGSYDARRWRASMHVTSKRGDATRTILVLPPFADTATRSLDARETVASLQFDAGRVHGGIDLARQHFDVTWSDGTLLGRTDSHRDVAAAHATARMPLAPRLTAVAGLRFDRLSGGHRAWSPRLGVAAQSRDGASSFYVSAAHGFTAPTLEQLYDSRPLRLFGDAFTLANPELVPQRARGIDAGAARTTRFGSISADAYLLRVRDEIDFDARTFRYANIARSEHRGVELAFDPAARYVPRVAYAWTRVRGESDAQLKNIPEHTATLMLPLRNVTLLYAFHTGRFFDDDETIAAPDHHALSVRLQQDFGRARVALDVLNATGARNAALGYALTDVTGGLAAYAYPDQRRSARLSVTITN
jgi:outer membrane cobalamin receptor